MKKISGLFGVLAAATVYLALSTPAHAQPPAVKVSSAVTAPAKAPDQKNSHEFLIPVLGLLGFAAMGAAAMATGGKAPATDKSETTPPADDDRFRLIPNWQDPRFDI